MKIAFHRAVYDYETIRQTDTFKIYKRFENFFYENKTLRYRDLKSLLKHAEVKAFLEHVSQEIFDEKQRLEQRLYYFKILGILKYSMEFLEKFDGLEKSHQFYRTQIFISLRAYTKAFLETRGLSIDKRIVELHSIALLQLRGELEREGFNEEQVQRLVASLKKVFYAEPDPRAYEVMKESVYEKASLHMLELYALYELFKYITTPETQIKVHRFYDKDIRFYIYHENVEFDRVSLEEAVFKYKRVQKTEGFQMYEHVLQALKSSDFMQFVFERGFNFSHFLHLSQNAYIRNFIDTILALSFDGEKPLEQRLSLIENLKLLKVAFQAKEAITFEKKSEAQRIKDNLNFLFDTYTKDLNKGETFSFQDFEINKPFRESFKKRSKDGFRFFGF